MVQDGIQRGYHIVSGKGLLPGRHLVEHYPEGKKIAARIERLAAGLLRRHVNSRAGNDAHSGEGIFDGSLFTGCEMIIADQLGEAEIEHLGLPILGQKDICWLDIAMNDPLTMRSAQSVRHLNRDLQQLIQFHRLAVDPLFQAFALQLLHHNERIPIVIFNFVDSADGRMI